MRYFGRVYGSRIGVTTVRTYSCKQPVHSDPPCVPPNTKCFVVEDKCGAARDYLTNKIPLDKHMVEAQRRTKDGEFEPPCCVSRMVFPPPEKFKPSVTKPKERPPFRSMWEPKCEAKEQFYCKKMLPRFDEMFYHPSDKKRAFQRTWTECPPIKERLKKVCCLDAIEPPEIQRRVKERCPAVTCTFDYVQMRHVCKKTDPDQNNKCRKIHWPCCKPARCPPYCHRVRKLNKCLRLRAPHKSFSETRQWQRPLRERECNRVPPSICEILREGLHQKQFKLKSECPTG